MLDRKRSARSHFYKIGGVGILRALATFPPRDASMELAFAQPGPNTLLVMFKARGDGSLSFQLGDGSSGRVDLHDRLPLPELDVAGTKALRYGRIVTLDENTLAVSVQHVVVKSVWGWGAGSNEASVGAARAPPVAARELAVFADLAKSPHANLMSPLVTGVDCWGTVHMVLPCGSADLMDCILHTHRWIRQSQGARGPADMPPAYFRHRERQVKPLLRDAFRGVAELHRRGWAHLDVAGENVVVFSETHAKVIDFEFAARLDGLVLQRQPRGRTMLWSPELAAAYEPTAMDGAKVDAWACAVLALLTVTTDQLWTLAAPSDRGFATFLDAAAGGMGSGMPAVLHAHGYADRLSPQLRDLLSCMTRLDPASRLSVADALDHAWFTDDGPMECVPAAQTGSPSCRAAPYGGSEATGQHCFTQQPRLNVATRGD